MLPNCDNSAAHLQNRIPRSAPWAVARSLVSAPINLDVEIPDLLPQRIAVEAKQVGGADLIAPGHRQRRRQQRHLDLLEDAVIEARRRHAVGEAREMRGQIGLDRAAEIVDAERNVAARESRQAAPVRRR